MEQQKGYVGHHLSSFCVFLKLALKFKKFLFTDIYCSYHGNALSFLLAGTKETENIISVRNG
jgi:hypothetical protein